MPRVPDHSLWSSSVGARVQLAPFHQRIPVGPLWLVDVARLLLSGSAFARARIRAFSFTSICWRAASQACGDTIGGVFSPGDPLVLSMRQSSCRSRPAATL